MRSDADIQRDVEYELRSCPHTDEMDIRVQVHDGVVRLTGFACSYFEKHHAESNARRVGGVASVVNDIELHLCSAEHLSDEELRASALRALRTEVPHVCDRVEVLVKGGEITLWGSVAWHFLRERAESAIRRLVGVTVIHNAITIEPEALTREIRQRIEAALHCNVCAESGPISVETRGGDVTLRGQVHSGTERLLAEQAAWSVQGVTAVSNLISARA
jgi:osmotically-inducible protein OsmY